MGWEKRQRGGDYYYRTVRVNGKPRRVYLGTGGIGRVHEMLDERERQRRDAKRAARREHTRRLDECDRLWRATWPLVRAAAHTALILSGWYSHKGTWRPIVQDPRTRKVKAKAKESSVPDRHPATPEEDEALRARLAAVNDRANAGDAAALAELRAILDENPGVWRALGDLNRYSVFAWTTVMAGKNLLQRESIARNVADWKEGLGGPAATPVERAIIDTAAVARLSLAYAEWAAATVGDSLDVAESKVKRLDAATRRYNATLKLLVQVRAAHPQGLVPASPPAGSGRQRPPSSEASSAGAFPRLYRRTRRKRAA